jgi:hypothetical protein
VSKGDASDLRLQALSQSEAARRGSRRHRFQLSKSTSTNALAVRAHRASLAILSSWHNLFECAPVIDEKNSAASGIPPAMNVAGVSANVDCQETRV